MSEHATSVRPLIVHVLHHDGPGGGPHCVMELLRIWKDDYDQAVVSGGRGSIAAFCAEQGLPFHDIGLDRAARLPLAAIRLARLLRRLRPAVVVLMGQWAGCVGAPVARRFSRAKVIHIVQFSFLYVNWDLRRTIRNHFIESLACRNADAVVVVSPGSRYQYLLRGWPDEDRLHLIPNSFDPGRIPPAAAGQAVRSRHGWQPSDCHVVSVGRLEDQKRVDWLLRSWQLVERAEPAARLWIVGGGREERRLHALAVELQLERCVFLGPQPQGIDYVAAADIVAMTSLYEMHAILPLEAMGCGRPIVASNVDGVGSSIRDGVDGLLVSPGDIAGFANALRTLVRGPERRAEMGRNGQERIRDFAPETSQGAYRALFAELGLGRPVPQPLRSTGGE